MSVLRISEKWDGRGGESGGITDTRSTRSFLVITSSRYDDEFTIAASGLLPTQFSSHPHFAFLTARRTRYNQRSEHSRVWDVEVEYSSEPLSQREQEEAQQQSPNPLARAPQVRWASQQYAKAIHKDLDGKALVNSAGDPFDPPVEVDRSRWVVTISKNVSSVPPVILTYSDSINDNPFTIGGVTVEAKKAKLMALEISELQVENDIQFYVFTYAMEFRKEGWTLEVLDQGLRQKDPNDATLRIRIQDDGDPAQDVQSPWPLDGSGGKLADPKFDTVKFLEFRAYEERDFSILPGLVGAA